MKKSKRPTQHGLCKMTFLLEPEAWHGFATERLWVEPVAGGRYRLRNSPFYAFGVSAEDVVFGEDGREEELLFSKVALRAGHSTYRIIPLCDQPVLGSFWKPLQSLGCTYEEGYQGLLAVDVPPKVNIFQAYALLEKGEVEGAWSFEEGHCGHPVHRKEGGL